MNAARELMKRAYIAGIFLKAEGQDLIIKYKKNCPVPLSLKNELRNHKIEILNELKEEQSRLESWHTEGWILLYSHLLDELVVIVKDAGTGIPERLEHFPLYELREIKALSERSEEDIKRVHRVKKIFKGTIQ